MKRWLLLRHFGPYKRQRRISSRRNKGKLLEKSKRRNSRRNRGGEMKSKPRKSRRRSRGGDLSEKLPLEFIMKRLPLRQRVQALCVSKTWNHLLRDSVNTEMEEMQKGPWLVMARYFVETGWDILAYKDTGELAQPCLLLSGHDAFVACAGGHKDVTNGLWMGCKCSFSDWPRPTPVLDVPRLASSGGLMCGLLTADVHHVNGNVVVFNCLTGSMKMLPPPRRTDLLFEEGCLYHDASPCPCYTHMAVDDLDRTRYFIMLTRVPIFTQMHFSDTDRHTEVFDSNKGGWTDAAIPWDRWDFFDSILDGNFFFLYEYSLEQEVFLAAYSVAHDKWSGQQLPAHLSRSVQIYGECALIHKFAGQIYLAIHLNDRLGFQIWEVRQTSSAAATWVEIACTPPLISNDLKDRIPGCHRRGDAQLLAGGNFFYCIYFMNNFSVHECPPLVFDITRNSWYFLPAQEWPSNYYGVLLHQPSLSARI